MFPLITMVITLSKILHLLKVLIGYGILCDFCIIISINNENERRTNIWQKKISFT